MSRGCDAGNRERWWERLQPGRDEHLRQQSPKWLRCVPVRAVKQRIAAAELARWQEYSQRHIKKPEPSRVRSIVIESNQAGSPCTAAGMTRYRRGRRRRAARNGCDARWVWRRSPKPGESGTVTARKAGGLRDLGLDVDLSKVGVRACGSSIWPRRSISLFQTDYGEKLSRVGVPGGHRPSR